MDRLEAAEYQYDCMAQLLETLRQRCAAKCMALEYGEGDLARGEADCTDRCAAKFMQAHAKIGNWAEQTGAMRTSALSRVIDSKR